MKLSIPFHGLSPLRRLMRTVIGWYSALYTINMTGSCRSFQLSAVLCLPHESLAAIGLIRGSGGEGIGIAYAFQPTALITVSSSLFCSAVI